MANLTRNHVGPIDPDFLKRIKAAFGDKKLDPKTATEAEMRVQLAHQQILGFIERHAHTRQVSGDNMEAERGVVEELAKE